jgi:hypothetical protein
MLRQWWDMWARPITVIVSLISIGALGALYVRRPPQRWTITRDGIVSLESQRAEAQMDMLTDSVYVVQLAPSDGAPYPVHLAFYYYGTGVTYTADEVRGAIASAVESRPGATLGAIAQHAMFFEPATPGILIKYDLWANGGVRSEIVVRCPVARANGMQRPVIRFYDSRSANYSTIVYAADLAGDLNMRLSDAAQRRCEETALAGGTRP